MTLNSLSENIPLSGKIFQHGSDSRKETKIATLDESTDAQRCRLFKSQEPGITAKVKHNLCKRKLPQ